ncbi:MULTISPECIES: hypothetical protein [Sphingomonadales]|jgi:hypothetical protein|uniref:Uncharacterized protein n=2 Tax=Sphingomonadaceae TaxID=41297 RepID=A0A397PID4_9SPHN|nr:MULTISPECIES: hypothetical protein [Sphingomonadaceae]EKU73468.1 hypothetical protein HMPREF9718_03937 [Sphingobium yanoikuyae ATCC 51230]RIA45904.1 hypothetical protein DFR49_0433 [Hephaestia caeni]WQE08247.1 hypothetical protein U0025_04995 [Sphingobium yanoikuyae]
MTGRDNSGIDVPGERSVRHSRRFSDQLVEKTRKLFQERTTRQLTNEDARQILENLTGFFRVLGEWDRAQEKASAEEQLPENCRNVRIDEE